ncbi:MAG TPA: aldose epimerase family protein [Gemmatimonadaceae bacterium]|nr:aldose epimerase family protein [Gemmatimonadaceae bacterium]
MKAGVASKFRFLIADVIELSAEGISVEVIPYGAIIVAVRTPDRDGNVENIVLGFDDLDSYANNPAYFGAIVGRYANRIANARFSLDGSTYELSTNDGRNCLHGGTVGFDRALWVIEDQESDLVTLTHDSPDGDRGFPGALRASVTYSVKNSLELRVQYRATTDAPTVVNLTQHSYWNLLGRGRGDVLDHEVEIRAKHFTPVDRELIPTGEIARVDETPFDFRKARRIGERINATDEQIEIGAGYDHNFVLDRASDSYAARVKEPVHGRIMEVHTTEPGVQLYTGNRLDHRHAGFCLETQHFPDSPNRPQFPSTVLRPGEMYESETRYVFGAGF